MKRASTQILLACALALGLVGCVRTSATMLSSQAYPPLHPEDVTIYLSEDDIPADYEKIAILNATGSTTYTNERHLYEAMKKRAARIGANGILHAQIKEPSQATKIAGAVLGMDTERKAEMIAIYVHH